MKSVNRKSRDQPACSNCMVIQKIANKLYSFYTSSNKRQNKLRAFCIINGYSTFRLAKIYEIRWVSSHLHVMEKIIKNYDALTGHLRYIKNRPNTREFDQNTIDKAGELYFWLTSKYFISTVATQLDIQVYFSLFSEEFQKKGELLYEILLI